MENVFLSVFDNSITIRIDGMRYNDTFLIKQNDTLPSLTVHLKTQGCLGAVVPYNLSAATAVTFSMSDGCGNLAVSASEAEIVCASGGTVQYEWSAEDTGDPGVYHGEFKISFSGGTEATVPTSGRINIKIARTING